MDPLQSQTPELGQVIQAIADAINSINSSFATFLLRLYTKNEKGSKVDHIRRSRFNTYLYQLGTSKDPLTANMAQVALDSVLAMIANRAERTDEGTFFVHLDDICFINMYRNTGRLLTKAAAITPKRVIQLLGLLADKCKQTDLHAALTPSVTFTGTVERTQQLKDFVLSSEDEKNANCHSLSKVVSRIQIKTEILSTIEPIKFFLMLFSKLEESSDIEEAVTMLLTKMKDIPTHQDRLDLLLQTLPTNETANSAAREIVLARILSAAVFDQTSIIQLIERLSQITQNETFHSLLSKTQISSNVASLIRKQLLKKKQSLSFASILNDFCQSTNPIDQALLATIIGSKKSIPRDKVCLITDLNRPFTNRRAVIFALAIIDNPECAFNDIVGLIQDGINDPSRKLMLFKGLQFSLHPMTRLDFMFQFGKLIEEIDFQAPSTLKFLPMNRLHSKLSEEKKSRLLKLVDENKAQLPQELVKQIEASTILSASRIKEIGNITSLFDCSFEECVKRVKGMNEKDESLSIALMALNNRHDVNPLDELDLELCSTTYKFYRDRLTAMLSNCKYIGKVPNYSLLKFYETLFDFNQLSNHPVAYTGDLALILSPENPYRLRSEIVGTYFMAIEPISKDSSLYELYKIKVILTEIRSLIKTFSSNSDKPSPCRKNKSLLTDQIDIDVPLGLLKVSLDANIQQPVIYRAALDELLDILRRQAQSTNTSWEQILSSTPILGLATTLCQFYPFEVINFLTGLIDEKSKKASKSNQNKKKSKGKQGKKGEILELADLLEALKDEILQRLNELPSYEGLIKLLESPLWTEVNLKEQLVKIKSYSFSGTLEWKVKTASLVQLFRRAYCFNDQPPASKPEPHLELTMKHLQLLGDILIQMERNPPSKVFFSDVYFELLELILQIAQPFSQKEAVSDFSSFGALLSDIPTPYSTGPLRFFNCWTCLEDLCHSCILTDHLDHDFTTNRASPVCQSGRHPNSVFSSGFDSAAQNRRLFESSLQQHKVNGITNGDLNSFEMIRRQMEVQKRARQFHMRNRVGNNEHVQMIESIMMSDPMMRQQKRIRRPEYDIEPDEEMEIVGFEQYLNSYPFFNSDPDMNHLMDASAQNILPSEMRSQFLREIQRSRNANRSSERNEDTSNFFELKGMKPNDPEKQQRKNSLLFSATEPQRKASRTNTKALARIPVRKLGCFSSPKPSQVAKENFLLMQLAEIFLKDLLRDQNQAPSIEKLQGSSRGTLLKMLPEKEIFSLLGNGMNMLMMESQRKKGQIRIFTNSMQLFINFGDSLVVVSPLEQLHSLLKLPFDQFPRSSAPLILNSNKLINLMLPSITPPILHTLSCCFPKQTVVVVDSAGINFVVFSQGPSGCLEVMTQRSIKQSKITQVQWVDKSPMAVAFSYANKIKITRSDEYLQRTSESELELAPDVVIKDFSVVAFNKNIVFSILSQDGNIYRSEYSLQAATFKTECLEEFKTPFDRIFSTRNQIILVSSHSITALNVHGFKVDGRNCFDLTEVGQRLGRDTTRFHISHWKFIAERQRQLKLIAIIKQTESKASGKAICLSIQENRMFFSQFKDSEMTNCIELAEFPGIDHPVVIGFQSDINIWAAPLQEVVETVELISKKPNVPKNRLIEENLELFNGMLRAHLIISRCLVFPLLPNLNFDLTELLGNNIDSTNRCNKITIHFKANKRYFLTGVILHCRDENESAKRKIKINFLKRTQQITILKDRQVEIPFYLEESLKVFIADQYLVMSITYDDNKPPLEWDKVKVYGIPFKNESDYSKSYISLVEECLEKVAVDKSQIPVMKESSKGQNSLPTDNLGDSKSKDINSKGSVYFLAKSKNLKVRLLAQALPFMINHLSQEQVDGLMHLALAQINSPPSDRFAPPQLWQRLLRNAVPNKQESLRLRGTSKDPHTLLKLNTFQQVLETWLTTKSLNNFKKVLTFLFKATYDDIMVFYLILSLHPNLIKDMCKGIQKAIKQLSKQLGRTELLSKPSQRQTYASYKQMSNQRQEKKVQPESPNSANQNLYFDLLKMHFHVLLEYYRFLENGGVNQPEVEVCRMMIQTICGCSRDNKTQIKPNLLETILLRLPASIAESQSLIVNYGTDVFKLKPPKDNDQMEVQVAEPSSETMLGPKQMQEEEEKQQSEDNLLMSNNYYVLEDFVPIKQPVSLVSSEYSEKVYTITRIMETLNIYTAGPTIKVNFCSSSMALVCGLFRLVSNQIDEEILQIYKLLLVCFLQRFESECAEKDFNSLDPSVGLQIEQLVEVLQQSIQKPQTYFLFSTLTHYVAPLKQTTERNKNTRILSLSVYLFSSLKAYFKNEPKKFQSFIRLVEKQTNDQELRHQKPSFMEVMNFVGSLLNRLINQNHLCLEENGDLSWNLPQQDQEKAHTFNIKCFILKATVLYSLAPFEQLAETMDCPNDLYATRMKQAFSVALFNPIRAMEVIAAEAHKSNFKSFIKKLFATSKSFEQLEQLLDIPGINQQAVLDLLALVYEN